MRFRYILTTLVGMTLFITTPGETPATTALAPTSFARLTELADVVAQGRVGSIVSYRENDRIFTNIEIEVIDILKGEVKNDKLILKLYGGSYGGRTTRVLGAPCFTATEEVVLFLGANRRASGEPRTFSVVSLAEGKFTVVRQASGEAGVARDLSGINYMRATEEPQAPHSLEQLKQAVRSLVR